MKLTTSIILPVLVGVAGILVLVGVVSLQTCVAVLAIVYAVEKVLTTK